MAAMLLAAGILVALFVGLNIGGSSTGVAFGPAVGSKALSKTAAAFLMSLFALLGGWTVGRNVVTTMGNAIVPGSTFALPAAVGVLFFVGAALLLSNLAGVPASTSMTAVGAIAGLGVATGTINWQTMGVIVSWWVVAPVLAFWICAVIGRYLYPHLATRFPDDAGRPGAALVIGIGCYMAFSAGASNVANAVAPLVGNGALSMDIGVLLAAAAIAVGAFSLARKTLETVGSGLTELPLMAALIVEIVAATVITALSWMGIPASLAVSATMCVVGLGWGRATRTVTLGDAVRHTAETEFAVDVLTAEDDVREIGDESPDDLQREELFDPSTTGRVFTLWMVTPSLAAALSFLLFSFVPLV